MTKSFLAEFNSVRKVYLDTNILIYHLEDVSPYASLTQIVFEGIIGKKFSGHISVLGIMELNVGLYQQRKPEKVVAQTALLSQVPNFFIHPVDIATADTAAKLRAEYKLKPPDAIHAATSSVTCCDTIIGNDRAFSKLKGMRYIHLDNFC